MANSRPRLSISAEVFGKWNKKPVLTPKVFEKSSEEKKTLLALLGRSFLFDQFEEEFNLEVINAFEKKSFAPRTKIVREGDKQQANIYVIIKGQADAFRLDPATKKKAIVESYTAGQSFGQVALLYNHENPMTIVSRDDVTCWMLDRTTFNDIIHRNTVAKRQKITEFLTHVKLLKHLTSFARSQLVDVIKTHRSPAGTQIIREGEEGDFFFILESGTCQALKNDKLVYTYKTPGEFFGELALLRKSKRLATVTALTDCVFYRIDREPFDRLLGPLQEQLEKLAHKNYGTI